MFRKSVAIGFLLFSIVLLYMGYERSRTIFEGAAGTFLNSPWLYFVAGAALFISGAGMMGRKKRKR